ncbi:MAG: hypothetical protein O7D32_00550 [bacterium]|nr:hypothetical protein [bacterium]
MKSSKRSKKDLKKSAPETGAKKRAIDPSTLRRVLTVSLVVSGLSIAVASFFPDARLWGLNQLAFYPLPIRIAALVLMALAWVPAARIRFARMVDVVCDRLTSGYRAVPLAGGVAALASFILFYVFRARTRLLGDGELVMRYTELQLEKNLSAAGHVADIFGHESVAPGTSVLYFVAGRVASASGASPMTGLVVLNAFLGALYVFGVVYFVWKLRASPPVSFFTSLFLVTTGTMVLFFGYIENYAALYLLGSLFVFTAILSLTSRMRVWVPIVLFVLTCVANVQGILLAPALAYVVASRLRGGGAVPRQVTIIVLVLTVLATVGARSSQLGRFFLPAVSTPDVPGVFSVAHMVDVVNELFLLLPMIPFIVAVSFVGRGVRGDAAPGAKHTGFVVLLLAPFALFLFFFNPELGMARDWDLYAMLTLPLIFLFVMSAERGMKVWNAGEHLRRVMLPAAATGAVALLAWVGINASEARTINRIRAILSYDTANATYLYESIAMHYRRDDRINAAIGTMNEAFEFSGDPMYLYNSSLMSLGEGDTLTAVDGFRQCLEIREGFPQARINLAIQLYNLGEWEELMRVCTDGVRLEPQNPYYHYYFGLYYEESGESELARNRFMFCLRQPIPDDMRKDVEAALERLAPGE